MAELQMKSEPKPAGPSPQEMVQIDRFFEYAKARHDIYLKRQNGEMYPWTEDPILSHWKFTNVFRELDKTTVWFRENIRDPLRDSADVFLATITFRWFNKIETGEAIFQYPAWDPVEETSLDKTPWELFRDSGDVTYIKNQLIHRFPAGPYFTGAFIVRSPQGMNKLDGVLMHLGILANKKNMNSDEPAWRRHANVLLEAKGTKPLQYTFGWLKNFSMIGGFTAYEMVSDMRWTALHENAPDVMSWANPGPGCTRGLNRIKGRSLTVNTPPMQQIVDMRKILQMAPERGWDGSTPDYPKWEMRDVEHTLCEFDKYERERKGEGHPKTIYRPHGW